MHVLQLCQLVLDFHDDPGDVRGVTLDLSRVGHDARYRWDVKGVNGATIDIDILLGVRIGDGLDVCAVGGGSRARLRHLHLVVREERVEARDGSAARALLADLVEVFLGGGDVALALVPQVLVHDLRAVLVGELLFHGHQVGVGGARVRMELAQLRRLVTEGRSWRRSRRALWVAEITARVVVELGLCHGGDQRNREKRTHGGRFLFYRGKIVNNFLIYGKL